MKEQGKSRFSITASTGAGATESLKDVEAEVIKQTIAACVKAGVAVTFGRTRDGSCLTLALLDGGQVHKAYAGDAAEFEAILETVQIQANLIK